MIAATFGWCASANAVYKCVEDGQTQYQDRPCGNDQEVYEQLAAQKRHYEDLYRRLDEMAARGEGIVNRVSSAERKQPDERDKDIWQNPCDADSPDYHICFSAKVSEQTARNNQRSQESLNKSLEGMMATCGNELIRYPAVGMSDETFRICTAHARFNWVSQIINAKDGKVPIRLYIFQTERAKRIYVIGNVITKIED